jgi:hypothetical protein
MLAFLGGDLFAYFAVSTIFIASLWIIAFAVAGMLDLYTWITKPKK